MNIEIVSATIEKWRNDTTMTSHRIARIILGVSSQPSNTPEQGTVKNNAIAFAEWLRENGYNRLDVIYTKEISKVHTEQCTEEYLHRKFLRNIQSKADQ